MRKDTKSDSSLFLEIYVNNQLLASLWGHTKGVYASAGNAVITSLVDGDVVSVKTRSQHAVNIYGKSGQIYTAFTGVQIDTGRYTSMSAFSVGLTQHQEVHTGQNVLYNNILTDTNTAYSDSTGVYTVPSSGLYIFHFFSSSRQNPGLWQELFHNNIYVCSIYGRNNQDLVDAGNTVLLHVKKNDQISVRALRDSSLYGTFDQIYSTLTGTQLVREANMSSGPKPIVAFSVGLSHHVTVTTPDQSHI
ncbi:EMILIN-2-like [Ruditapes philippinarum]|uniref:EMILIN-2-like n=1 Tax=Ruditapes philippinarum TaxID=129788 RepID=UPI00295AAC16|nr:EMILIN-2-like [Ruditapes philippinarum]